MSEHYVDVESLNFRDAPDSTTDDNIIGKVYLTQKIDVTSDAGNGWVKCRAKVEDNQRTGYVKLSYLRAPVSENREKLISSVSTQFFRFKRGLGKENIAPFAGYVGEMWKSIGINHLDGTDQDVPWSAAAISFMVRKGGDAYRKFAFAAAHSKYVHHAIQARLNDDRTVPFWGYRLHEVRPEIGDIVARDNPEYGPVVTYDVAASLSSYRSHTDIVVHINSAENYLLAIGGNVSNSVSVAKYALSPGDYVSDAGHTFAILKNCTDGFPSIA